MKKTKKLAGAVRSASGREKLTAIGETDLVVALGSQATTDVYVIKIGDTKLEPTAVGTCNKPHVDYVASA